MLPFMPYSHASFRLCSEIRNASTAYHICIMVITRIAFFDSMHGRESRFRKNLELNTQLRYEPRSQAQFVVACCVINNLIKDNNSGDAIFEKFAKNYEDNENVVVHDQTGWNEPEEVNQSQAGIDQMSAL